MAEQYYKQVRLNRLKENFIEIPWIPEGFAKLGKTLDLKQESGEWSRGWVVTKVYKTRLESKILMDLSNVYKHTREASDV